MPTPDLIISQNVKNISQYTNEYIKKLKKGQITKPILSSNRFVIAKFVDERNCTGI